MTDEDTIVQIGLPLPLSVVGFLMRAIGTAYPGTMIDTTTRDLRLRIPYAETHLAEDAADAIPPEALEGLRDDPQTEAFLHAIRHNGTDVSLPPWLSSLLTSMSEQIIEASEAPNYLQIEVRPRSGEPFAWIVCRPGRPSPHDLRRTAEAHADQIKNSLRTALNEADKTGTGTIPAETIKALLEAAA